MQEWGWGGEREEGRGGGREENRGRVAGLRCREMMRASVVTLKTCSPKHLKANVRSLTMELLHSLSVARWKYVLIHGTMSKRSHTPQNEKQGVIKFKNPLQ